MLRGALAAVLLAVALPAATVAVTAIASPAIAQTASSIVVEGNRRVEAETIRTYFKPGPGGRIDSGSINDGLRALYETGLFQDVRINQAGGRLVVTVIENPVISRVIFEGNKKVKDEQLATEVQSKPRGSLSRPTVQSDTQRITEIYRRQGRYDVSVVPQIIEQPNNRVDLVFEISEGGKTGVRSIEFVGNSAVSSYRLRDVIKTRETNILSFLGSGDVYDPDRVEADRDLIRRYYLKNGYADIQVVAALTEYDPERRGFMVTFKIEEGQQYRVGSIDIQSNIRGLDANAFRPFLRLGVGSVYNGEQIEKSVEEITVEASRRGYAFATVRPRGERNFQNATVSIVLVIEEGPRVYVERINVRGNTRTKDYVIRREFDIAEGDAYNRALVDRAERRLKNLDYFKTVKILTEPGSSADRVILVVDLEEKSTGDFSVSGGYSTSDGFLAEVSVAERNLLGTGLYAKAGVQYGQRTRGYTLSVVEPFLFGYRIAGGIDIFQRQQLPSSYVSYETRTTGGSARLGFALREDLTMQVRYSLYKQEVGIDDVLKNCNNNINNTSMAFNPTPALRGWRTGSIYPHQRAWLLLRWRSVAAGQDRAVRRTGVDLGGRLHARLQHPRQQQGSDQRPAGRIPSGHRRSRRRREVPALGGRRPLLLPGRLRRGRRAARSGWSHHGHRRRRPPHAGPLPDGPEPRARLCAGRPRSARHHARHVAGRAWRHDVLGRIGRTADAVLVPAQGSRPEGRGVRGRRLALGLQGSDDIPHDA